MNDNRKILEVKEKARDLANQLVLVLEGVEDLSVSKHDRELQDSLERLRVSCQNAIDNDMQVDDEDEYYSSNC